MQYESTIVTNENIETVETVEASSEEQSPPTPFSPAQMPSGSVYAPVTVNLDSSIFSEQTRLLEQQLRDYKADSEAKTEALAQQADEARRRQRNERVRGDNDHRDEELAKISQNFEQLVKSFRELQNQTHQSLQQVSSQVENREMAAELAEAYKRSLQLEEERRKEIIEASRLAAALEIQKFANQQQQDHQHQQLLELKRIAAEFSANSRTRVAQAPRAEAVPQHQPQPQPAMALPQPLQLPSEPTSSFVAPETTIRTQASSISQPRILPAPRPNHDSLLLLAPRIIEDPKANQHSQTAAAGRDRGGKLKSDLKSADDSADLPNLDDDKPLEVTSPPWQSLEIGLEPDVQPLRVPTLQESASLKPVQTPRDRRIVKPVAYANTYRFTMDVDAEGQQRVVSAPRSSRQEDGESATHTEAIRSELQQTSAANNSVAAIANPSISTRSKSAAAAGPTKDLRRDTRNAGRGMNKNFGAVASEVPAEDRKPWLRLSVPSLTTQDDEPSLLHRMSSAVRQMGRSVQ